MEIVRDCWCTL